MSKNRDINVKNQSVISFPPHRGIDDLVNDVLSIPNLDHMTISDLSRPDVPETDYKFTAGDYRKVIDNW